MSFVDELMLHDGMFAEIPGLRGLRVAALGERAGKHLEVVEAACGVVIPAMTHPAAERGRVLAGALRFAQEGVVRTLRAGDTWHVEAGGHQGPHVALEHGTRVAILREGPSAWDPA